MTVLCLIETGPDGATEASLRALGVARNLAGSGGEVLAVAWFGPAEAIAGESLFSLGVSSAFALAPGRLSGYAPLAWARALEGLAGGGRCSAVVAAGTDRGHEVLAHLGAITGLPMAANCVRAAWASPGECRLERQRWAGSLLEDAVLTSPLALLTVAADAVPVPEAVRGGTGGAGDGLAVEVAEPELADADLVVRAAESAGPPAGTSLATARVVIGGGRGVGGPDGFAVLDELAELLGAAVGVSRVVTSQGWRPHRQQVGQTGTKIAPELYLACGISGAIQHLAGCQGAKAVVAVNTDADAPIMARADYAVVGDLHEVIPALVAALRDRAGRD